MRDFEALAKKLYEEFDRQSREITAAYVGEYRFVGGPYTCLDGNFDLKMALETILSEEVSDAGA